MQYNLEIDLEDSYYGNTKKIKIPTQKTCKHCNGNGSEPGHLKICPKCDGSGKLKKVVSSLFGQMVTIVQCDACHGLGKISDKKCEECKGKGIISGEKILDVKIPKGVVTNTVLRLSKEGFNEGNLYINIIVKKHPYFSVQQDDIYVNENINLLTALNGGEIKVKTIKGFADLKIPAGTQNNTTFKMKGLGMPNLNSSNYGNQYVKVNIEIPNLTKEQKEQIEEILSNTKKQEKSKKKKSFFSKN